MNTNDCPPSGAYGRVSEPERYRVLHAAASRPVQELVDDFDVVAHEGTAIDPGSAPGVHVQFGRWEQRSYPSCGCDACDEDPVELVRLLRREVRAVVDGNFREELRRGLSARRTMELWGDDRRSVHHGSLKRREVKRLGQPGSHEWRPWPRRAPG